MLYKTYQKMPQQTQSQNDVLVDLNMRIRILEEKQNIIRERLLVINQNMIDEYKRLVREVKTINSDIGELKEDISNIKDITKNVIRDMQKFAKKDSVNVLEKYIKMWNPLNFMTEDEVRSIIKKEVGKYGRQTE